MIAMQLIFALKKLWLPFHFG